MRLFLLIALIILTQANNAGGQPLAVNCEAIGIDEGYTTLPTRIAESPALVNQFWAIDAAIYKRCPGIKNAELEVRIYCPDSSKRDMYDVFVIGAADNIAQSKAYRIRLNIGGADTASLTIGRVEQMIPTSNWDRLINNNILPIMKGSGRKNPFASGPRINQQVFMVLIRCRKSTFQLLDFWDDMEQNSYLKDAHGNLLSDLLNVFNKEMKIAD